MVKNMIQFQIKWCDEVDDEWVDECDQDDEKWGEICEKCHNECEVEIWDECQIEKWEEVDDIEIGIHKKTYNIYDNNI